MKNKMYYKGVKLILPLLERIAPSRAAQLGFRLFCTPPVRQAPASSRAGAVVQAARCYRVQVDAVGVQVYQWQLPERGPRRRRPTVILVHGWGASTRTLFGLVGQLLMTGFDVIGFDLPAHGNSSGDRTTLSECLRALQVVEQKFGPAYALVGHGFGGSVAALASVPQSHLATVPSVERLVIIGAPDRFSSVLDRFGREVGISAGCTERVKQLAGDSLGGPVECFSTGSAVWAADLPVLVIHDKNDPEIPHSNGRAIAGAIEQGIFISTEEGSRIDMVQSRRVARETARFLEAGLKENRRAIRQRRLYRTGEKQQNAVGSQMV